MVSWFEVPVLNMDRAVRFYETVFALSLERKVMGPLDMALFPAQQSLSGALVRQPVHYSPSSKDGVLLYFSSPSDDLAIELQRVERAGGRIIQHKSFINQETGYVAIILDSEGNRIALHSLH